MLMMPEKVWWVVGKLQKNFKPSFISANPHYHHQQRESVQEIKAKERQYLDSLLRRSKGEGDDDPLLLQEEFEGGLVYPIEGTDDANTFLLFPSHDPLRHHPR